MPHHDRALDLASDIPVEWAKSNWLTHPVFKRVIANPSAETLDAGLSENDWTDGGVSQWTLRAAFFVIDEPGVRSWLYKAFSQSKIPPTKFQLWPHPNVRARFFREELMLFGPSHSYYENHQTWLRCLALAWPWLWMEDAVHQGMGEAHPVARLTRAGHESVIPLLCLSLTPSQWMDWKQSTADRMVALLVRRSSSATFSQLLAYDPRLMAWRHKKDHRHLLHEVCTKLRVDMVEVLLSKGVSASAKTRNGVLPAQMALQAALEGVRIRQASAMKNNEIIDRLDEILTLLANAGGLEGSTDELMRALKSDHLERMRGILQRALLASATGSADGTGSTRRL